MAGFAFRVELDSACKKNIIAINFADFETFIEQRRT